MDERAVIRRGDQYLRVYSTAYGAADWTSDIHEAWKCTTASQIARRVASRVGGEVVVRSLLDACTPPELCSDTGCEIACDLLAALYAMTDVFGPSIDYYGDGAGHGEIDAVNKARAAIAKAEEQGMKLSREGSDV